MIERHWSGRLRQRAFLLHRVQLRIWYYRGPGDGARQEDWTEKRADAQMMDYLEANKMAMRLGHGYFAALSEPTAPESGRQFFERVHHDRAAEAEASTEGLEERVRRGRSVLPAGDRE